MPGILPTSLITGIITIVAGIVVLIWPKVLTYIVGIYLIIVGLLAIANALKIF